MSKTASFLASRVPWCAYATRCSDACSHKNYGYNAGESRRIGVNWGAFFEDSSPLQ